MTEKLYLGRLLRTLREERMLTQGDVAEILHVSRQHYSRFENDQAELSIMQLAILQRVYDCDLFSHVMNSVPEEYVAEERKFKARIPMRRR